MGERYGCVSDSVGSGVLVPLLLQLGHATEESGCFHIARSTDFDAALAYVAFCCACKVHMHPAPSSCYLPISQNHWKLEDHQRPACQQGWWEAAWGLEESRLLPQQLTRVTWRAVNYGRVDHGTVLAYKYFYLADDMRLDPDVENVSHNEEYGDRFFDELDWTLDELQLSISEEVRLCVPSAFDDVKMPCAACRIEVPADISGGLSLLFKECRQLSTFSLATLHELQHCQQRVKLCNVLRRWRLK